MCVNDRESATVKQVGFLTNQISFTDSNHSKKKFRRKKKKIIIMRKWNNKTKNKKQNQRQLKLNRQ